MKLSSGNHLCYSLNVYPGNTPQEKLRIISEKVPEYRRQIPGAEYNQFALGLWFDINTTRHFCHEQNLQELKRLLLDTKCYVYTFNAFPYGEFHGNRIKEKVYFPNWTTTERYDYTCMIADILSHLLPEGMKGSISTLPGAYKEDIKKSCEIDNIAAMLLKTAEYLYRIEEQTGKHLILAFEMEPDCIWETPTEFIRFYDSYIRPEVQLARYIGVCYDTCHQELIENLPGDGLRQLLDAEIPIGKIQLSAALKATNKQGIEFLKRDFTDDVYFHQTRLFSKNKIVEAYKDLSELKESSSADEIVVHYHMPIYCEQLADGLDVLKDELNTVIEMVSAKPEICSHLEIETYTHHVLPESIRPLSTEISIAREYGTVLDILLQEK